ncbi:hypothetical protein [Vulcanisaeta thermophila]|nr:hypothetical protein [Vulcanisaeta thermophila]
MPFSFLTGLLLNTRNILPFFPKPGHGFYELPGYPPMGFRTTAHSFTY